MYLVMEQIVIISRIVIFSDCLTYKRIWRKYTDFRSVLRPCAGANIRCGQKDERDKVGEPIENSRILFEFLYVVKVKSNDSIMPPLRNSNNLSLQDRFKYFNGSMYSIQYSVNMWIVLFTLLDRLRWLVRITWDFLKNRKKIWSTVDLIEARWLRRFV